MRNKLVSSFDSAFCRRKKKYDDDDDGEEKEGRVGNTDQVQTVVVISFCQRIPNFVTETNFEESSSPLSSCAGRSIISEKHSRRAMHERVRIAAIRRRWVTGNVMVMSKCRDNFCYFFSTDACRLR